MDLFALEKGWWVNPFESGFFLLVIGVLFAFSTFHFFLFLNNKNKLYLLYSAYTFLVILSQLRFVNYGFIDKLLEPIKTIKDFPFQYTELYYMIYVFYSLEFLETAKEFPKFDKLIKKALKILLIYCGFKFIIANLLNSEAVNMNGYFIYTVFIGLIAVVAFYIYFKQKHPLKYYIIIGGLMLLFFSYASLFLNEHHRNLYGKPYAFAYTVLYIGFLLETILFALGLGHNQKLIMDQKSKAQRNLISEMKDNELLKQQINAQLHEDVSKLSKKAQKNKSEVVKMIYEKELSELSIATLRNQMNPHFIFNALNSIKRYIIDNEQKNAIYYLNKFYKLITKILSSSKTKSISLNEELDTMELYVNLENLRLSHSIIYSVDIQESIDPKDIQVPAFILQPFLENAIWHGLSIKEGKRLLNVTITQDTKELILITIKDNGIGLKKSIEKKKTKLNSRSSYGIQITRNRLELFSKYFTKNGNILIEEIIVQNLCQGTCVTISVPII